jgi:hypothetical protein
VFIVVSVLATAMPTANGMITGITDGSTMIAISRKVAADCPVVVMTLMRVSTCVVHTIARTQNSVAAKIVSVRRVM